MYINGYIAKEVKGFEGIYYITENGTLYRKQINGEAFRRVGSTSSAGYQVARLSVRRKGMEEKHRLVGVHQLVAEAFIDNPKGYTAVDHIDENKSNNHVSNLRWCTPKMNSEYYYNKDGFSLRVKGLKSREQKVKAILQKVKNTLQEIKRVEKAVQSKMDKLDKDIKAFEDHKRKEEYRLNLQHNNSYNGYKNTKGLKFSSVVEAVKATGKPIKVNNKVFISCGSAAQYIIEQIGGDQKKKKMISKELRKMLNGKRPFGTMYNEFSISNIE